MGLFCVLLIKNTLFLKVVWFCVIVKNSTLEDLTKNKVFISTLAVILPVDIWLPAKGKLVRPLPFPEKDPLNDPDNGYNSWSFFIFNAIYYSYKNLPIIKISSVLESSYPKDDISNIITISLPTCVNDITYVAGIFWPSIK